ncbi:hypothetical protein HDZ31DRAFT_70679 [Schizophyllum fasciatum]
MHLNLQLTAITKGLQLIDDAPDPRLVDSFGRRRKTIAHSSSQMVLDGSFPVDLSPIIEDTSVFPPLTSNAQDPPVEKPVVPPKSGLRRVVARKSQCYDAIVWCLA